jgi:HlyD family secretion protein
MSVVAIPSAVIVRRRIPWVLVLGFSIALVGALWVINTFVLHRGGPVSVGEFYTIVPLNLDVTIAKDGELQAVNNVDIVCPVEGQSVVLDIAKEGSFVHKGDVIVRIDSTDIKTKIEASQLEVQKSQSDFSAAQESKAIQESKNAADLESAQVDLTVAKLDLLQYTDGDFPADFEKAKIAVKMSETTLKNKDDDLAQTKALFGKGFVTASDVKTAELAQLQAKNDLATKQSDLTVLEKYQHEKELAQKTSALKQAEKKLIRVQRENASNLAQRVSALQSSEQTLALRKQQLDHLQEQLASCTIKAPSDGMVVYGSSGPQARRDTPIQPGATVRQQELLVRLPDTGSMKLVCKINETQVARLKVDANEPMRALIEEVPGQTAGLTGWISNISVLADSSQRWWNPDAKDYPVDVTLDQTPQGLKPGMGAKVRVFIDRMKNALAVPLSSVYAAGRDSYVFIRENNSTRPVKVAIGEVNETHAQVLDGVTSGQQVLILQAGQGRELLEKAGIKVQPAKENDLFAKSNNKAGRKPGKGPGNGAEERRGGSGKTPTTAPAAAPATAPAARPAPQAKAA